MNLERLVCICINFLLPYVWQGYIFWPFFFGPNWKNWEEFEGGLHKKGREKGEKGIKKKRVIKHTLKYLFGS